MSKDSRILLVPCLKGGEGREEHKSGKGAAQERGKVF